MPMNKPSRFNFSSEYGDHDLPLLQRYFEADDDERLKFSASDRKSVHGSTLIFIKKISEDGCVDDIDQMFVQIFFSSIFSAYWSPDSGSERQRKIFSATGLVGSPPSEIDREAYEISIASAFNISAKQVLTEAAERELDSRRYSSSVSEVVRRKEIAAMAANKAKRLKRHKRED